MYFFCEGLRNRQHWSHFIIGVLCPSRKEISKIMKSSYLRGLNMASFFCASKLILFVTFTLYVLLGNTISASSVFVTVSLYSAVRLTVTLFFPSAIEKLFESRVSVRRIQVHRVGAIYRHENATDFTKNQLSQQTL